MLFLLVNIAYLIVLPWETTEGAKFRDKYGSELDGDIRDILSETNAIAERREVREISANLLMEVVAHRREGVRTRNLAVWGP